MYQEWPFFQSTVDLIEMVRAAAASPASTAACKHALQGRITALLTFKEWHLLARLAACGE